ncbi:hypothetical protein HYU14_05010 [Candidatus Woesearchaeota archaeon]|nr:hypothetical protein [Candidatus Woesearchaeota archaeon]
MNEKELILQENYEEYLEFAEQALEKKKFNAAVTLFFKAIPYPALHNPQRKVPCSLQHP